MVYYQRLVYSAISSTIFTTMLGYYSYSYLRGINAISFNSNKITGITFSTLFFLIGATSSYYKYSHKINELNKKYTPIYLQSLGKQL